MRIKLLNDTKRDIRFHQGMMNYDIENGEGSISPLEMRELKTKSQGDLFIKIWDHGNEIQVFLIPDQEPENELVQLLDKRIQELREYREKESDRDTLISLTAAIEENERIQKQFQI